MESKLNVIFLPFPTPGHMIPMIDTARLFARHGATATIITTKANALTFQKAIDSDFISGYPIKTHVIPFPASQLGLPDGVENIKDCATAEMMGKVIIGHVTILKDQIELLFQEMQPDCLVTDLFYPWTAESASKLGIPRLHFYSSGCFTNCVVYSLTKHRPHEGLADTDKFTIPGLPHTIELTPLQLEESVRAKDEFNEYCQLAYDSEGRSYGTLYNSYRELEGGYEEHRKSETGFKGWSIGPVSNWVNKDDWEKANRGGGHKHHHEAEWLNWLNSKQDDSVLYVNFGSLTKLPYAQLVEIAHGLESSGHDFIWVIREKDGGEGGEGERSFLRDFEQRMKESNKGKGKGCIIWDWAPQLLILDHPATGGIVTHCGWNSILEGLSAGLPMITWPMFADQFYNERLVVDVLKIGVPMGAKENKHWTSLGEKEVVRREDIRNAIVGLMASEEEESKEMRRRAKSLGDAGKRAIQEGGSSYNNLMQLMDELKSLKISRALAKTKLEKL